MKQVLMVLLLLPFVAFNQLIYDNSNAQSGVIEENIKVVLLAENEQASNFMIWVTDTVATHKHLEHSETIVVLQGSAKMYLGEQQFFISKDAVVFIPKNTWHAVKVLSEEPLQVLSIQAPKFDPKDRVFRTN